MWVPFQIPFPKHFVWRHLQVDFPLDDFEVLKEWSKSTRNNCSPGQRNSELCCCGEGAAQLSLDTLCPQLCDLNYLRYWWLDKVLQFEVHVLPEWQWYAALSHPQLWCDSLPRSPWCWGKSLIKALRKLDQIQLAVTQFWISTFAWQCLSLESWWWRRTIWYGRAILAFETSFWG